MGGAVLVGTVVLAVTYPKGGGGFAVAEDRFGKTDSAGRVH